MSVRIRMVRQGRKNAPHYRIVVTDKKKKIDGEYIEKLGVYNSKAEGENKVAVNEERLKYWLKQGAQLSNSLASILRHIGKKLD